MLENKTSTEIKAIEIPPNSSQNIAIVLDTLGGSGSTLIGRNSERFPFSARMKAVEHE